MRIIFNSLDDLKNNKNEEKFFLNFKSSYSQTLTNLIVCIKTTDIMYHHSIIEDSRQNVLVSKKYMQFDINN